MVAAAELQSFLYEHRSWPADPRQLGPMRAEVRGWLESSHLGEDLVDDLVMAVSEAVSNAVEHAYRPITAQSTVDLTVLLDQGNVDIEIVDHGRWQLPAARDTGRGRGIALIQRMVDSVVIHFDTAGTRVMLHHPVSARRGVTGTDVDRHNVKGCDGGREALISA